MNVSSVLLLLASLALRLAWRMGCQCCSARWLAWLVSRDGMTSALLFPTGCVTTSSRVVVGPRHRHVSAHLVPNRRAPHAPDGRHHRPPLHAMYLPKHRLRCHELRATGWGRGRPCRGLGHCTPAHKMSVAHGLEKHRPSRPLSLQRLDQRQRQAVGRRRRSILKVVYCYARQPLWELVSRSRGHGSVRVPC
jgi:hypothetical protein